MKSFLIIIFTAFIFSNISYSQVDQDQIYKFNQVIENINNFYVDSIDNAFLIEKAIISTLKELDPHSVYFSKDEVEEINRGLVGSFIGVGISYDIIQDTVLVLSIVENGPSDKAGLIPGDRIVFVGEENIGGTGITDKKLKNLLSGVKGSRVEVSVKRRFSEELLKCEIVRNKIKVNSIDAAYNESDDIAYIKLNRFSANTMDEFREATDTLINKKTQKLILDLRNNSGGYLNVSVRLLENFLKKNTSVLFTKGIHKPEKEYKTQKTGKLKNIDLIVLIDESSASASEIVSGAIQDWDRGIIIGRRSYGKGLVQKPIYLIDGSMIRLTIAKYFTPSGRNIQKPYDKGIDQYKKEITQRFENGELMNKDSIKYDQTLKFYTLNNKRMIFGGGGIMPDIFVPVDTLRYPYLYRKKSTTGKVNEFVHLFVDSKRDEFKKRYPDFLNFNREFHIKTAYIMDLVDYICDDDAKRIKLADEIKDHELIKIQLKALIAYDLWGESEYHQIINSKDDIYLKAVEILTDKKLYTDILNNDIVGEFKEIK